MAWQLVDAVVVNFTASPLFSRPGITVNFTDLSGNLEPNAPCTFEWDFGDGSAHVFSQNATHIYNRPGNFSVTHFVQGSQNLTRAYKTLTYPVGEPEQPSSCDPALGNTTGIALYNDPYASKWAGAYPNATCIKPYLCMCAPSYTKYQCLPNGGAIKISDMHADCCKFCGKESTGEVVPHVAAPNFKIIGVDVTQISPNPGDIITAVAQVSNTGDAAGAATIVFTWNDGTPFGAKVTTGIINVNNTVNAPAVKAKAPATGIYNLCASVYGQ